MWTPLNCKRLTDRLVEGEALQSYIRHLRWALLWPVLQ